MPRLTPRFTELLVLPRYEVPYLPHWTSLHGTALAPKTGSARIMLVGDAAHAAAPDSGQGASMALEDVQNARYAPPPLLLRSPQGCQGVRGYEDSPRGKGSLGWGDETGMVSVKLAGSEQRLGI